MKYTPDQERAVYSDAPFICVDAGAGSGKTRILVDRMVSLLTTPGRWPDGRPRVDRIVALTFMEKAAAEMKTRLRDEFRKRAEAAEESADMTLWRGLERGVDAARMSTIHAFCSALLRQNALRLGLDPDFQAATEGESRLLLGETVTAAFHGMLEEGDGNALLLAVEVGPEKAKAALSQAVGQGVLFRGLLELQSAETPAALLAHWKTVCEQEEQRRLRGLRHSGKVRRCVRRLEECGHSCTNPADGRAARRRIALEILGEVLREDGHPDRLAVLRAEYSGITVKADGKNWTDPADYKQAGDVVDDFKKLYSKVLFPPLDALPETDANAARLACAFAAVARTVMEEHRRVKRERNLLDFDDLITGARDALRDDEELRRRTAAGIRHLLIDEFQDTDSVQLEIAHLLHREANGPDLFIVGDAKQSVYLFRGAEVGVFRGEKERAQREGEAIPLSVNFRSRPGVLNFVNEFFQKSSLLSAVETYKGMDSNRSPREGAAIEVFVSTVPEGEKWRQGEHLAAEADFIAGRILEMTAGKSPLLVEDKGTKAIRPARFGDIALLFRRGTQAHLYEEALRRAGIPYCRASGEGFYERQEVEDFLNLLKAAHDPWDEPALLSFLRGPAACLCDDDILRMRRAGGVARVFNGAATPEGLARPDRVAGARSLLARLRAAEDRPLGAFVRLALEESGLDAVNAALFQGVQRVSNLRKLAALADVFDGAGTQTPASFIRYLDEVRSGAVREGDASLETEGGDAVVILTVHKAKGLEFPVVFLPDMNSENNSKNGILSMHRDLGFTLKPEDDEGGGEKCSLWLAMEGRNKREAEAESARTLYVALTRARDHLVLCGPEKPKDGSWSGAVDAVFGFSALAHGVEVAGENGAWRARVLREPPVLTQAPPRAVESPESLRFNPVLVAPPAPSAAPFKTISVTSLLNMMFPGTEEDEPQAPDGEGRRMRRHAAAPDRVYAMARGTLAHRLFELWDFKKDVPPDLDMLLDEAALGLNHRPKLREELENMTARFRASELFPRVAADGGLRRELPFQMVLGGVVLRGTIDLLLGDFTVVDHKTGAPKPEKSARYALQLALYALAVRGAAGQAPPGGLLYYVDKGLPERVDLSAEALRDAMVRAESVLAGVAPDNRKDNP